MKRNAPALEARLAQLSRAQLRRERTTVVASPAPRMLRLSDGRELVDFSSNDYLGLAHHPALVAAMGASALRDGAGSAAAHLVTGHGAEHAALEEELAAFTGRERALLFSTGYMANLAVLSALGERGECVLLDRLSHASLIDGARLCGARLKRYAHADAGAAQRLIATAGIPVALIATDALFSMDGDLAPLPQLAQLAAARDAWLVVDDAHGLGVLGPAGRGTVAQFGLSAAAVPVLIGTLGKAFGSFGAFVAGDRPLIDFLINTARPYLYTTALPQPVAAATRAALRLSQDEPWRRARVHTLTARFRSAALAAGVPVSTSVTPIQPVLLGSAAAALTAQQQLAQAGLWVGAMRPPTVPAGAARLRITLGATHSEAQIDHLVGELARVCARLRESAA